MNEEIRERVIQGIRGVSSVSWYEIYRNEAEMLDDLRHIDIVKYTREGYKGYQTIGNLQNQMDKGLSKKQMTQLKRLSKWVKWYRLNH